MKLVLSIVHQDDADSLLSALSEEGHRATKISSTGGFLRKGNVTIMVGTEDHDVHRVLNVIRRTCRTRTELYTPLAAASEPWEEANMMPMEVQVGGATVFILKVDQFHRF